MRWSNLTKANAIVKTTHIGAHKAGRQIRRIVASAAYGPESQNFFLHRKVLPPTNFSVVLGKTSSFEDANWKPHAQTASATSQEATRKMVVRSYTKSAVVTHIAYGPTGVHHCLMMREHPAFYGANRAGRLE